VAINRLAGRIYLHFFYFLESMVAPLLSPLTIAQQFASEI